MKCPVCTDATLAMSNREGIEIDYCPECRGVWLDRGELDKIIERSAGDSGASARVQAAPARAIPRHDDDDDDDHRRYREGEHPKRKKRGMLSDLFDFD